MSGKLAVNAEHLIKTFSGNEVIKGCNLSVPVGCIYGLIGANGAGKTTLFKLHGAVNAYCWNGADFRHGRW